MIRTETIDAPPPAAPPINVVDRIDAMALWPTLSPELQAAIGAAALDLAAAWGCKDMADELDAMFQHPVTARQDTPPRGRPGGTDPASAAGTDPAHRLDADSQFI